MGEYHDLHVQSDTLLLADAFKKFWIMCLEINQFDPARSLTAPWLAWQAASKKTKVKLDLLTDINMLLMVEKGIRGGIWHSIDVQKLITNTWKTMKKIKNRHTFSIGM